MSHDREYNELIHTARWRRLRVIKLSRNPLCERCKQQEYITAATEVHHRTPVETALTRRDKERLMFAYDNLQALCSDCHHYIHNTINAHSKEGVQQRTADGLNNFIQKFL